jgi:hypothetical protein
MSQPPCGINSPSVITCFREWFTAEPADRARRDALMHCDAGRFGALRRCFSLRLWLAFPAIPHEPAQVVA